MLREFLRASAVGAFRAAARVTGRRGFAALLRGATRKDPAFFAGALRTSIESLDADGQDAALPEEIDPAGLVTRLRRASHRPDAPFFPHLVHAEIAAVCAAHGHRPRRVLEIGPGASVGTAACFLAAGAESAAAVDVEPLRGDRAELHLQLGRYLAVAGGPGWWRYASTADDANRRVAYPLSRDAVDFDALARRVDYRAPHAAHALPFADGELDLVYSTAALEHVDRPRETVAEIFRVLAPGGLAVHEIDLRRHGTTGDLLALLRWTDEEWSARTQKYGGGHGIEGILDGSWKGEPYCNRLRESDWRAEFARAGFDVLAIERLCVLDAAAVDPARFAEPWRSRPVDDLRPLIVRIAARRPVA
jgi:SAM-dependent methyltransferase